MSVAVEKPSRRQPMLKKVRGFIRWVLSKTFVRKILHVLDMAGGVAIRTRVGAHIVGTLIPGSRPVLCSDCFSDHGLALDAARIGILNALPCPNCGAQNSKKLTLYLLEVLASQFFVRGSVIRARYGSAPFVQFNKQHYRKNSFDALPSLRRDAELIGEKARIGFFEYGPRLWMIGYVTPLEELQDPQRRDPVIKRLLKEYPQRTWSATHTLYRLRANPSTPSNPGEYDSPPDQFLGQGRLDSLELPIMYCSQDIEGCVHECRVTVEDELYLAALKPVRELRLLDLTELLAEEHVTEFESLDMAVHMLFYAAEHSYPISRAIAVAARDSGFDGLIYPSYFSQVRSEEMPFETVYGISVRRFPKAAQYAQSGVFPNVALFGRPLRDGIVGVTCINRLILRKARYNIGFGPVSPPPGNWNRPWR